MADYIDRQAALSAIDTWDKQDVYPPCLYEMIINDVPSADVAPVVRCKDCKHNYSKKHNKRYNHEDIVCDYWETDGMNDDDFCSYGARMEKED